MSAFDAEFFLWLVGLILLFVLALASLLIRHTRMTKKQIYRLSRRWQTIVYEALKSISVENAKKLVKVILSVLAEFIVWLFNRPGPPPAF